MVRCRPPSRTGRASWREPVVPLAGARARRSPATAPWMSGERRRSKRMPASSRGSARPGCRCSCPGPRPARTHGRRPPRERRVRCGSAKRSRAGAGPEPTTAPGPPAPGGARRPTVPARRRSGPVGRAGPVTGPPRAPPVSRATATRSHHRGRTGSTALAVRRRRARPHGVGPPRARHPPERPPVDRVAPATPPLRVGGWCSPDRRSRRGIDRRPSLGHRHR
jgi:hypothetical protein